MNRWRNFKAMFRVMFQPTAIALGTPLFCLMYMQRYPDFCSLSYHFGWRLLLWPSRWDFAMQEGEVMYRKDYRMLREAYLR